MSTKTLLGTLRNNKVGPAPKKLPRQPGAELQTVPAQYLVGTYTDAAVEEMAAEDGKAELYTGTWGEFNREPRVIHAVNQSAETADSLISHSIEAQLSDLEGALEGLEPEAALAEDCVLDRIKGVGVSGDKVYSVRTRCEQSEIAVPEHHWRRMTAEISGFVLLGIGDLYFVSTTFQVFGLSDARIVSFLPINQLQMVAISVVAAMLLLTRMAGHKIRKIGQLVEEVQAARRQESPNAPLLARHLVRTYFLVGTAIAALFGAFITLYGLSEVRASFLQQEGINAHQSYYLMIQAGIAFAGLVLAFWMSHPLDVDWRSACHHYRQAVANLKSDYAVLVDIVGRFNGLLRQRDAALIQSRDWTQASTSDAIRQGHLIARRLQLSLPEPVVEQLMPNVLPVPPRPALATTVDDYLKGTDTYLKAYLPLTMVRVEDRLKELDERRKQQGSDDGVMDDLIEKASEEREPESAQAPSNGKGPS